MDTKTNKLTFNTTERAGVLDICAAGPPPHLPARPDREGTGRPRAARLAPDANIQYSCRVLRLALYVNIRFDVSRSTQGRSEILDFCSEVGCDWKRSAQEREMDGIDPQFKSEEWYSVRLVL